jgi:hypothetical protein
MFWIKFKLIVKLFLNIPEHIEKFSKCSIFRLFETTLNVPKFCSIFHYNCSELFQMFPKKSKKFRHFRMKPKHLRMFENIFRILMNVLSAEEICCF